MRNNRIIIAVLSLILISALFLASCSGTPVNDPNVKAGSNEAGTNEKHEMPKSDTAYAYYAVFEDIYACDDALNSDIKYISLDLSDAKYSALDNIVKLFEDFCEKNGFTLLQDNYEGLVEKGYIEDMYFKDGIIISFDDIEVSDKKLVTSVTKWRSGLGAIGAEYTVKLNGGTWLVKDKGDMWIS